MTPRASALPPAQRRAAIVEATVPLLRDHGREVTTKQIARAAGVAEGTIFRVFDTKEDLVEEAVRTALDLRPYLAEIEDLTPTGTVEERLLRIAEVMHRRYTGVFALMSALGMMGPPEFVRKSGSRKDVREEVARALLAALGDTGEELRIPPTEVVALLRMLTFAGCNQHLSAGRTLRPGQVVDLLLHGVRKDT